MATPDQYVARLAGMGISVEPSDVLTSAIATRAHLERTLAPGSGVLVVGMPALADQLFRDVSFHPVTRAEDQPAAVVVGLDKHFTYETLSRASAAIRGGARFIATNTDATLPTENGLVPGCGSLIAAIQTATSVAPEVIGKPEPSMLGMAAAELGVEPSSVAMVGDRLDTDIVAGHRAGMLTVLVLTGISTAAETIEAEVKPDIVVDDLPALLHLFESATG
jgi:4-nitrophenyl phosphatase